MCRGILERESFSGQRVGAVSRNKSRVCESCDEVWRLVTRRARIVVDEGIYPVKNFPFYTFLPCLGTAKHTKGGAVTSQYLSAVVYAI